MPSELDWIARATGATEVRRAERIQSLWGGYGEIFRVHVDGGPAIVKSVEPPARSRETSVSHARKCRSYAVEAAWYRRLARTCDDACRVPTLLASECSNGRWRFLLEDLDAAGFAERRRSLGPAETERCLAWLAAFHARFLGVRPEGLWNTGSYWHLATRQDELAAIEDPALREAAPLLDRQLRSATFRTLVHGDAKPANFCFAPGGRAVAAVDFQYVGGGCGVVDVAYLLASPSRNDAALESRYLDAYFRFLREALGEGAAPLEAEWRRLYPIACADYYRFLAGWAKEHWRSEGHGQRVVRDVLRTLN